MSFQPLHFLSKELLDLAELQISDDTSGRRLPVLDEARPNSSLFSSTSSTKYDGKPTRALKKTKRDPRAPRGAKSSYNFFSDQIREKVKVEMPELAPKDVHKEVGSRWREISAQEKSKFEAMATIDKERYDAEKAEYDRVAILLPASDLDLQSDSGSTDVVKRSQKAKSAYQFFSDEMRPRISLENPGLKCSAVGRELWRQWKETEPIELDKYNEMAIEDMDRLRE